ncbi:protein mono-ADP-ribosyltransferase PARP12-like isoform X1 [Argopecten irradians]|uniref:protein mono-ADP-ribosyltransferase PARP12-like isoform X1 n=3 Tax=Argopecten irradians TaxID=31199 RepID=UPI0037195BFF
MAARRQRSQHDNPDEYLSRTLAKLLRHGAENEGLTLMEEGYLFVDDILELSSLEDFKYADVKRVVENDEKDRFTLKKHPGSRRRMLIRDNFGHSLEFTGNPGVPEVPPNGAMMAHPYYHQMQAIPPQMTNPQNDIQAGAIVQAAIKLLCHVGGPLYVRDLAVEIYNYARDLPRMNEPQLHMLFRSYPNNFLITRKEGTNLDVIQAVSKLGLCSEHCTRKTACMGFPVCDKLHICKFYLLSNSCRFSKIQEGTCMFGHDLTTQHNRSVLQQQWLSHLTVQELRYLFQSSESRTESTLPHICKFYNVGAAGCRNITQGIPCPYLHICRHYVMSQCKFGQGCKRNHDINNTHVREILAKHGINLKRAPKEILADLRESVLSSKDLQDNVSQSSQSSSTTAQTQRQMSQLSLQSQDESSDEEMEGPPQAHPNKEICIFHLRGRCGFGRGCHKSHKNLPYQWQYREAGQKWVDLPPNLNVDLEINYSDVNKNECFVKLTTVTPPVVVQLNFDTMTGVDKNNMSRQVRRLSTASSGAEKFTSLATQWKWFWLDEGQAWREYGEQNVTGYKAIISSEEMEQRYLENPTGQLRFATLGHEYLMDFDKMVQQNLFYQTERVVRRRPVFVAPKDVAERKKRNPQSKSQQGASSAMIVTGPLTQPLMSYVPMEWAFDRTQNTDLSNRISSHFSRVSILESALPSVKDECRKIKDLFYMTMSQSTQILGIDRVENGELWMNFVSKKEKMKRKKKDPNEKQLFHGTTGQYVDAICRQGFDFRFSGKTSGTKYGRGSYFAKSAAYADHYSNEGEMFLARVLVGQYAKGQSSFVRPPPVNPKDPFELYDSCVDSDSNPGIFVMFTFDQVYPEYVIKYRKASMP